MALRTVFAILCLMLAAVLIWLHYRAAATCAPWTVTEGCLVGGFLFAAGWFYDSTDAIAAISKIVSRGQSGG